MPCKRSSWLILMERKRMTAVKARIKSITSGKYNAAQGFTPGYVLTSMGQRLSRVRVLATVVDKFVSENKRFSSITVDDGTDTIRCKMFGGTSIFDGVNAGNIIDIVGKVKEYQGEVYLIPEVVKTIEDPNWELLRELELRCSGHELTEKRRLVFEHQKQVSDMEELKKFMFERFAVQPQDVESIVQTVDLEELHEEEPNKKAKDTLLKFIAELDKGEGCDYAELLEKSGLKEDVIDTTINELLEEGVCFEPKPGKIKKL